MSDVNQRLFNYMKEEHGVTLLESDINEIKLIFAEEGQSEQLKCPNCELDYDKEEIEMFRGLCESCRDRAF